MKIKKRSRIKELFDDITSKKEPIYDPSIQADMGSDLISGMTREEFLKALKKDIRVYNSAIFNRSIDDDFRIEMLLAQPKLIKRFMPGLSSDHKFMIRAIEECDGVLEEIDKHYFEDPNFMLGVIKIRPGYIGFAGEKLVSEKDLKCIKKFLKDEVNFKDTITNVNLLSPVVRTFVIDQAQDKIKAKFNNMCDEENIAASGKVPDEIKVALQQRLEKIEKDIKEEMGKQITRVVGNVQNIDV